MKNCFKVKISKKYKLLDTDISKEVKNLLEQLKCSVIESIEKNLNDSFVKTKYAIDQIVTKKELEIENLNEKSCCYIAIKVKLETMSKHFFICVKLLQF